MRNFSIKRATIFAIVMTIGFSVQNMIVSVQCWHTFDKIYILNSILSAIFFSLPVFFLPPSWRKTFWIPETVLTLLLLTNVLYLRNFGDFFWITAVEPANIFTPTVINSSVSLLSITDIFIILPPILVTILFFKWRRPLLSERYTSFIRLLTEAAMILLPILLFFLAVRRDKIYRASSGEIDSWQGQIIKTLGTLDLPYHKTSLWKDGCSIFLLGHLIWEYIPPITAFDNQEENELRQLLGPEKPIPNPMYEASIENNKGKNLIFVIVESFNSTLLSLTDSLDVMPTVKSLIADSTTLFAPNVLTQVGVGQSADGQLMYNTGLYPMIKRPANQRIIVGDYPSLAKALKGYEAVEAICENRSFNNHDITTKSFGYDRLYDDLSTVNGSWKHDSDTYLIDNVIPIIDSLSEPFFMEITTLSMHSPYDITEATTAINRDNKKLNGFNECEINYLDKAKCFDNNLKRLISHLEKTGILERTVIVLAGDHNVASQYLPDSRLLTEFVPLIVYNAGIGLVYSQPLGQIDIFPTIMQIMGIEDYIHTSTGKAYFGLGKSIVSTTPPQGAVRPNGTTIPDNLDPAHIQRAWELSEKAIRSQYFN